MNTTERMLVEAVQRQIQKVVAENRGMEPEEIQACAKLLAQALGEKPLLG